MSRRLPIAPRPHDDELLSSWQGRVACRYGVDREALGLSLGLPAALAAPKGFAAADYAPDPEVVAAWAQACRLDPVRIGSFALKRRRAQDRYVWAHEAGGAFVGFPACPACLDEDAKAGRDQYLRRPWLRVEALLCARHELLLVEDCERCGARGFGFNLLNGAARLVCRRCAAVVPDASGEGSEPPPGEKAVLAALGATSPDDDAMAAARLLWSLPRPGMARRPLLFWMVGHPRSARGMARDRAAPLSTASLDWRTVTWIGVAQLLDRAGAREVFGPPRFALDELKAWTRSRPLSRPRARMRLRPAAQGSIAEGFLARPAVTGSWAS